jgi:hypothetical protein
LTPKRVIRCESETHIDHPGNILCAFEGNNLYILCQDRDCKRFTKLTINIPGVNLNLQDAGITQEAMPRGYHLHLEKASTVVVA